MEFDTYETIDTYEAVDLWTAHINNLKRAKIQLVTLYHTFSDSADDHTAGICLEIANNISDAVTYFKKTYGAEKQ